MNKHKLQPGFAHLVTIAMIASLALIGVLGIIFWQNFSKTRTNSAVVNTENPSPKTQDVTDANSKVSAQTMSETISENVSGEKLSLNYPKTWSANSATALNPNQLDYSSTINIVSPNNEAVVTLWSNIKGIGGTCGGDDYVISKLDIYPLQDYQGYSLYSAVTHYDGYGYNYTINVLEDSDQIKLGASACNLGLGVFSSKNNTTNRLSVALNNIQSNNYPSMDEINSAIDTENYKTAVKIIQSLHKK